MPPLSGGTFPTFATNWAVITITGTTRPNRRLLIAGGRCAAFTTAASNGVFTDQVCLRGNLGKKISQIVLLEFTEERKFIADQANRGRWWRSSTQRYGAIRRSQLLNQLNTDTGIMQMIHTKPKRIFSLATLVATILVSSRPNGFSQSVPAMINYQGKLTDASGNPLPNGTYGVALKLWSKKDNTQPGNTLVWGQEYNVAVINGIFNVILGAPGGTPVTNSAVNDLSFAFTDAERYLGLTVTKGTTVGVIPNAAEIVPRQQILATPYALTASFASTAQNVVNGTPTGSIMPFAGSIAPTGWLVCNGAPVSRTTYSNLFAVVGTTYGSGDGIATFNLPDYRGRTLVGVDGGQTEFDSLGKAGGEKSHVLTVAEMPAHTHTTWLGGSWTGAGNGNGVNLVGQWVGSAAQFSAPGPLAYAGSDQPHNNLQPYKTVNYLIKN